MDFSTLTGIYRKLETTSSRLEMSDIIAGFIKDIPEIELSLVLLFLRGQVFPAWSDDEIGIGSKFVVRAISKVSGIQTQEIENLVRIKGDIGLAAEHLLAKKTQTTLFSEKLTIQKAYSNFQKIANLSGSGSQDKRIGYIAELLSFADPYEGKYIVRLVLEELRLGVGEGIVRDAISQAFETDPTSIEKAYAMCSDLGEVAKIAKKEGDTGVHRIGITPGRPIHVMLAQKIAGIDESLEKLERAAFEVKYDGARIQIHKDKDTVLLFTRRLENITRQFPEIVRYSLENIHAESAIIEGEMVAVESAESRKPRPFQDLSRRIKRKHNIGLIEKKIPVEVNLFDIIYLDNKSLLGRPFGERRSILERTVEKTDSFRFADQIITESKKEAEDFYHRALRLGHEGIMAKNLDAPYQAGSRVGYMYKIKPIMETLDLVIAGATWGEGRRANWLASFLLATYEPESGEYLTIGRMGTGFTDEEFREMTSLLKDDMIEEKGKDVILRPKLVIEVAYEEIQKSPTYTSGYALRFPRMVRIRTDKNPEDADTPSRVAALVAGDSA